jgi:hypothetical protein
MNGTIKNFTNAAMTSKQLRISSTTSVFPDYYIIEFQPTTKTIAFKYEGTDKENNPTSGTYQEIKLEGGCKKENINFAFATGATVSILRMNTGFRQIKPNELFTFSLTSGATAEREFHEEIPINVCLDETCSKEFFKWVIDTRSQGIFTSKCLFYSEEDSLKCKTRENKTGEN